jgi:ABC-type transport system involved in multi-copper enzyme maturation permease subunit
MRLALLTVVWMVRDTFRQSLGTKLFWGILTLTLLAVLFCLSIDVKGDIAPPGANDAPNMITAREAERLRAQGKTIDAAVIGGEVTFGFGLAGPFPLGRHREDTARMVQLWLAGIVADSLGVLMALLWTAGFLPQLLEPQTATVLLAKPTPRWAILLGKYLGVVLFVVLQVLLFVLGTWFALGIKTGIFNASYLMAVPLLALNFAIFYAVSAFLAVATRSTVSTLFGTLMVWLLCWAFNLNYVRAASAEPARPIAITTKAGYWLLPKPLDLSAIFHDAIKAETHVVRVPELERAQDQGAVQPALSAATSLLFALLILAAAAYEFRQTDY